MRGVLTLLVLSGCQAVFPVDDPPDPGTAICSTTRSFRDDFEAGVLDGMWLPRLGSAAEDVTVANGVARLSVGSNFSSALIETAAMFDLRGASFEVTADIVAGSLTSDNFIELQLGEPGFAWDMTANDGRALAIRRQGDMLIAGRYEGGNFSQLVATTFDPTTARSWRIEESNGSVIWSIAGGPQETYQVLLELAAEVELVRPRLVAVQGVAGPFVATFDDVNSTVALEPSCPASELVEPFDGTALDRQRWPDTFELDCSFTVTGGSLVYVPGQVSQQQCSIGSGKEFDLTTGSIAIELAAADLVASRSVIVVEVRGGSQSWFEIGDGMLEAFTDGTQRAGIPYDPAEHRWLRFRGEADRLILETSSDGLNFELLTSLDEVVGLDHVRYSISVAGFNGSVNFEVAGVNVLP